MKKIAWVVLLVMGVGATTTALAQSKQVQTKEVKKGSISKNEYKPKPISSKYHLSKRLETVKKAEATPAK